MIAFVNAPSKRERAERYMAGLLARDWGSMGAGEKAFALETAFEFGEAFAEEYDDEPDFQAYVDVCVIWARELGVIGDQELTAWSSRAEGDPPEAGDPRALVFALGCEAWRREHGGR